MLKRPNKLQYIETTKQNQEDDIKMNENTDNEIKTIKKNRNSGADEYKENRKTE